MATTPSPLKSSKLTEIIIVFGNAQVICVLRNGDIAALSSLSKRIDSESGDTHTPYCVI